MPKVLIHAREDWANMGWLLAKSLQAVDIDARAVAEYPHGFDYPEQAEIMDAKEILALGSDADVIIHMHSRGAVLHKCNAHHIVFHGGTQYRRDPHNISEAFNELVDFSLVQTGDLLGLGAKNEVWLLPPVDTDAIRVKLGITGDTVKIAHYPRNVVEKGSIAFKRAIGKIRPAKATKGRFTYDVSSKQVPWVENIRRMAECDIYLESFLPKWDGRAHLSWGVTALEAAALGKIVVTNFKDLPRYKREYGPCALQVVNNQKAIVDKLTTLILKPREELETLQVQSRLWVEKFHSFKAVGQRLKSAMNKYCWPEEEHKAAPVEVVEPEATEANIPEASEATTEDFSDLLVKQFQVRGELGAPDTKTEFTAKQDEKIVAFWKERGKIPSRPSPITDHENGIIASWVAEYGLADKNILEVGPGEGKTYRAILPVLENAGYSMIDFVGSSRDLCKAVTGRLPDEWDGITLPYKDNSFDLVISTDVMLHVSPLIIDHFVKEHARVTSKYLIVSTYVGPGDNLASHCFSHNYKGLFAGAGLKIIQEHPTAKGNRRVWLLEK